MASRKGKKAAVPPPAPMKEPEAFVKPVKKTAAKVEEAPTPVAKKELPAWLKDEADLKPEVDQGMCMSMWQPWAGLVISGAKRLEGRVWKSDFRGRLWIHAASKSLETEERLSVEAGITHEDAEPPKAYPNSCLLGCVDVIDMISHEELLERRAEYNRLKEDGMPPVPHVEYYIYEENESAYSFVCRRPKSLLMPLAMSGEHKIYQLEKSIHEAAKAQIKLSSK